MNHELKEGLKNLQLELKDLNSEIRGLGRKIESHKRSRESNDNLNFAAKCIGFSLSIYVAIRLFA